MSKVRALLSYCEELYVKGDVEGALKCAIAVAVSNANAPQPYAHLTAYKIILAAKNNRTVMGEPDWYTVFDIKREFSNANSIIKRYGEIMELLKGEDCSFKARLRANDIITRGMTELTNKYSRRAYDLRSRFL